MFHLKVGSKTISIPSLRWPRLRLPAPRVVSTLRLPPMPNVGRYVPRFALRMGGTKAVFFSLLVVVAGFAGAMFLVIEQTAGRTPIWPDAGAAYALPSRIGTSLPPDPETPSEASQTLQVTLATDTRLSELTFRDMNLGKAGLTDCVSIERDSNNSSGYLWVDEFIITDVSAPSFDMAETHAATFTLAGSVDGHTNNSTLDSTITDLTIVSERGAGSFVAESGAVDRIIVMFLGDANVGVLTFDGVRCSVGGWDLDHIRAGSITQDAASRFGTGSGINSADYVIQQSVKYRVGSDSLVDTPVTVR